VEIKLTVPDEFAPALVPASGDPARAALEAVGLEAYRQHRLTAFQLRRLLGIDSRFDLDAFLKEHDVFDYTLEDFENDLASLEALGLHTPVPRS
jgi:hypothetical protein